MASVGGRRHRMPASTTRSSRKQPRPSAPRAAAEVAAIAHQVHGAIGFTMEHVLPIYAAAAVWRDGPAMILLGATARRHGGRARALPVLAAHRLALASTGHVGTMESMTAELRFDQSSRRRNARCSGGEVTGLHRREKSPPARSIHPAQAGRHTMPGQPPHRRP
jgi:hypothetical protein